MSIRLNTIVLSLAVFGVALAPMSASAQRSAIEQRQKTKNEWRNIGTAAGLVALIGLLENDGTLTFVGTAGALYSAYRYEQDRKSQSKLKRARALYFSKPYFYRDGKKYVRRTVYKGGKKYYQFVKKG